MTFNYSINTGKAIIDSADQSYWQRITGSSLTLDGSNLFQNVGSMANAYKNLYGSELSFSDGYKLFSGEDKIEYILNPAEIEYKSNEELSRVDVYKNIFKEKLDIDVAGFAPKTGGAFATVFKDYSFYLYDSEGEKTEMTKKLSNIDKSNLSNPETQDQLKSLYKQLEEEANQLKETLYQDELAYGGYPEIEYTEVEAQNELLQQQLNMEMKNFQTLLEDMYNVMKVNAGGHDQDNGNTEDAMRFKEQEAATAATLAGKLVLDYAEKYYNHNIKPQADEYIFAQAFMDDNRVAGIDTVLNEYLGSYVNDTILNSVTFKDTLKQDAAAVEWALKNEASYEMTQQMLIEVKNQIIDKVLSSDLLGFTDNNETKLKDNQKILENKVKYFIQQASKRESGWKETLKAELSSCGVNFQTVETIISNIEKDANYYTGNSDIENAIKSAYEKANVFDVSSDEGVAMLENALVSSYSGLQDMPVLLQETIASLQSDWETLTAEGSFEWGDLQDTYISELHCDGATLRNIKAAINEFLSGIGFISYAEVEAQLRKDLAKTTLNPMIMISTNGTQISIIEDIINNIKTTGVATDSDYYAYNEETGKYEPTEKMKKLLNGDLDEKKEECEQSIRALLNAAKEQNNQSVENGMSTSWVSGQLAADITALRSTLENNKYFGGDSTIVNEVINGIKNQDYLTNITYKTTDKLLKVFVLSLISGIYGINYDSSTTSQYGFISGKVKASSDNDVKIAFNQLYTEVCGMLNEGESYENIKDYIIDQMGDADTGIWEIIKSEATAEGNTNFATIPTLLTDPNYELYSAFEWSGATVNGDKLNELLEKVVSLSDTIENKNMTYLMETLNSEAGFNDKIMEGVSLADTEKNSYIVLKTDLNDDTLRYKLNNKGLDLYDWDAANTSAWDYNLGNQANTISLFNSINSIGLGSDAFNAIANKYTTGSGYNREFRYDLDIPSQSRYIFDLSDEASDISINGVGDENINTSNIGALKDSQLAEIGDNTTDYITWMVRDFFGVGGITTDIKDTSYCFQEADPIAAKLVQSAENLVKLNMEKQKYNIEAAVNNQIRAEYEARLGAMQAINQILTCPDPTSENDPYNVEINGEKYILGKDINDDKVINSIVEIFGIDDTKDNVFQSLKALDDNQDGYVSKEELSAHNIIFNKVDNEGKLTAETFDISKIQGISLSELENADGTNNVFGLFKLDLESSRADGTVTFENDAYFDNLFSKNDVMTSMEEIDVETSQEVMPEVIETEENVFEKKYSFNLGEDNKNIFEKLFDELCWKMGINNISEVQKDKIIDSIDEDLDIDIVEAQMQQKLDTFNLSA